MQQKKKFGLALSGCGSRAVMYFALFEVLEENGIKPDMISACSSATFVACAYSSGRLKELKEFYFKLDRKQLFDLFTPSFKGGIFSFDKAFEAFKPYIKEDLLEDLPVPVSIVASDISKGDRIVLSVGDISRAIKASCCMPGIFEPVIWDDRILIDGGLFHIIPAEAVRSMGADIVVGVDLASTRNLFRKELLYVRKGYTLVTMPIRLLNRLAVKVYSSVMPKRGDASAKVKKIKMPSMVTVLAKSMDYAMGERMKGEYFDTNLIIKPSVKGFKDIDMGNREAMYREGRRAAEEALPEIKRLLEMD